MDAERLVTAVADLSQAATEDFALTDMLQVLCDTAAEALQVDGAGVMMRENGRNVFLHVAGAYSTDIRPLERLQEALQAGPCADCINQGVTVTASDLVHDGRWVEFQSLAHELQLRSVVSIPLLSRGEGWGVLDLYRRTASDWTNEELGAAQSLANVAVSYMVMAHDRDQARSAQQELAHRALHDELTGLPNRSLLFDRLEHALASRSRLGTGVAVVFLDLDLFKAVNDTFGHSAADMVLVEVASRLTATLREGDTLARFAGDEFVIICEGLPPGDTHSLSASVTDLTSRLQRSLQTPIRIGEVDVVVSASIGVAISSDQLTGRELLADADTAMYAAKQSGRGRVSIRDHTIAGGIGYARQLERGLVGALKRGELRVHYQPIVHANSRRVAAVEALLRWEQPDSSVLPAAAFVDIAVQTGLIVTIGQWVIAQACQQMAAWRRELPTSAPPIVYVNLSARELADEQLPQTISTALTDAGLQSHHLGIEIVEDDLAHTSSLQRLRELHERGHLLSIDDFGTGYSSLSRLVDLPVHLAKIDKSFVSGLPGHTRWIRFIDGVVQLTGSMDLQVVAEGVETSAQADHLTRAGCQYLQGHYLAPPQPADQLTASWQA